MNMFATGRGDIGTGVGIFQPVVGRFLGLDVGAETVKVVELLREGEDLRIGHREIVEHGKKPGPLLLESLKRWNWPGVSGAAVSGRFSTQVNLPRVPAKQALLRGYRFLFGDEPATIVNIGSHGFPCWSCVRTA